MTQKEWTIKELEAGRIITPLDALKECGCFRLGARILELRNEGHDIRTIINDRGKRYAKYYLVSPDVRRIF